MDKLLHDVSWVVPYRSDTLTVIFEALTWLGYPTFVMFFLPLGYWLWNKNSITRLAVIVIISSVLNAFLKDYWQNPRPPAEFRLDPEVGKSFGMPSGHAQVSAVLWFWLAYEIRRPWAWAIAAVLVAGIAFSRIYLGIHDLEDILAGLALAAGSLILFERLLAPFFQKFRQLPIWVHLATLVAMQLLVTMIWPEPRYSFGAVSLFGFLMAWLVGAYIEKRHIGFEMRRDLWAYPVVALLGVAGLIGLTAIIKPILAGFDPAVSSYVRALIGGLYMTAFAPFVFKTIRLGNNS